MIISISGPAGSGKSSIAKMLAEKLGWERYYMGGLRREKALEMGLTLAEYNKLGEIDPSTDKEVDEYQAKLGAEKDDFIIEGRTSWHFIPHSFKIYFDVNEEEGAQRIHKNLSAAAKEREAEKELVSYEEVLRSIRERKTSDIIRYKKYYNIDVYEKANYDFVLDTSGMTLEETWEKLWLELEKRRNAEKKAAQ